MYTISKRNDRRTSLPSSARRSYAVEKDSDYDSDATLDIEDLTPPDRPFGAPLRRMSDGPLGVPIQSVGQNFNSNKGRDSIEVYTFPVCDFHPQHTSSTSMPPIKRASTSISTYAPFRKLVDKVVSKNTSSSQASITSRPFTPSPLRSESKKVPQIISPNDCTSPSSAGVESQKHYFASRSAKKKSIISQVS